MSSQASEIPMTAMSPYYTQEHEAFRDQLRRFVDNEVEPYVEAWEAAGEMPRDFFVKTGEMGIRGMGYPEEYGGVDTDLFHLIVLHEEFGRTGSGGVSAAMMAHNIAIPPIVALADEGIKNRVLADVISGHKLAALCITEPGGGSDVAQLSTKALRQGDHYLVNGSKTFITGGVNADFYTVAVRTGGEGMGGVSLLLIERETPGFSRTKLDKMGWHASDTATLYFDDCRVPVENLIGEENQGFRGIMMSFNAERFGIAAMAYGFAKCAYDEAVEYAKQRQTFGRPIIKHQVIAHKLIDMATRINALKANLDALAWQINQGGYPVAETCMLKNLATETMTYCAAEAVQIFGGSGYMRGTKVERIYRETKVLAIGGGTEEIMKDLAARQLGW